jgi:hypothetical protein
MGGAMNELLGATGEDAQQQFGLNLERAIQRLRELADKLEANDYLLQGVEFRQIENVEDYIMSTLAITYAEKKTVTVVEKNLADRC